MTMSDATPATTLSVGSSAPMGHARSSIGSVTQRGEQRTSSSHSHKSSGSTTGGGDGAVVTTQRSSRTSVSRVDNQSSHGHHHPNGITMNKNGSSAKLTAMARMEQRGTGAATGTTSSTAANMAANETSASQTNNSTTTTTNNNTNNNAAMAGSSFDMRHSHYKEGIRLAEMGDWPILVRRLPREPQLARHKDHHGMLPLHWACTEDDAGPAVVHALLEAFPEGVLTRNNAQYLPIHIAVRAALPMDTLQLLCDARPSSLLEETPTGKTPLLLAIDCNLPAATIHLLRRAQQNYEDPSEDNDDDRNIADAKREIEVQSHLLRESMMLASNPINMMRTHSNTSSHSNHNNQSGSGPTLSVGRLQSNSVLGSFPAEARSSVSWMDRRGLSNSSSNQSFSGTTNTTTTSQRSFHQQSSSSDQEPLGGSSVNGHAVVRYMDTLTRDKNSTTMMIDEEHEMMMDSRYTVDEDDLLPPHMMHGQSSLIPINHPSSAVATAPQAPAQVAVPRMPTHLRATEGDLSNFNSGVCGVCYKKFSMFRKKYQCKSCWMVVCKKHVAAKVELPGHAKKRSVCADCFILHRDGSNVLPSVPGHSHTHHTHQSHTNSSANNNQNQNQNQTTSNTTSNNNSTSAIVPSRGSRAGSATVLHKSSNATRASAASSASSELRHTMATVPSAQVSSSSFSSSSRPAGVRFSSNASARAQKPLLSNSRTASGSGGGGGPLDRLGSDTLTSSLTETDRGSAEVVALHHRIATLEEQNKLLLSRLADQEKQYDDCMLLLTQTMTRVAEIEMRVPGLRIGANGSERESDASLNNLNPASFDFGYPMPPGYGIK